MEFNTIEEALESIDFEAVSMAMRILGWKVAIKRDKLAIYFPTAAELKECLLELYNEVTMTVDPNNNSHLYGSIKSGPWKVAKSKHDDSEMVGVYFTISKNILLIKDS